MTALPTDNTSTESLRIKRLIAFSDAHEKLIYASIGKDEDLRQEALRDLDKAAKIIVPVSDELKERIKQTLLINDPVGAHIAGVATYEECLESVNEDSSRLRGIEAEMYLDGHSLHEIVRAIKKAGK